MYVACAIWLCLLCGKLRIRRGCRVDDRVGIRDSRCCRSWCSLSYMTRRVKGLEEASGPTLSRVCRPDSEAEVSMRSSDKYKPRLTIREAMCDLAENK